MQTDDYWTHSRGPWASLSFILPFLVIYETGVRGVNAFSPGRSGADVWIRQAMLDVGFTAAWVFPLLPPLLLIGWQVWRRPPRPRSWSRLCETLAGMFAESLLFAMVLVLVGQLAHAAFAGDGSSPPLAVWRTHRAVSFLGAGIYEELLFRLMLLPLLYGAGRLLFLPPRIAAGSAILASSLLFATAHYIETTSFLAPSEIAAALRRVNGTPELWYSFTFRLLAGVLFSLLFWIRGFGVTAGCHMFYDLTVGVLLGSVAADS